MTSMSITILDLPSEIIIHICCYDTINTNDIFNMAVSHRKFNNCLFLEPNFYLWKTKYIQKYGQLDKDEFEVVNSWKEEIMLRMNLDKAVLSEIVQMPGKFVEFKNVPYHLYPFSEQLNSDNQGYYVLSASLAYYKHLLLSNKCCNENDYLLSVAHNFLIYTCQVYFSYKLNYFLHLPPSDKTVERGFYLLGRWWNPTDDTPYSNIGKYFNNMAITVCKLIYLTNPLHPLFEQEDYLNQLIRRGKCILDHDLYDEASTMIILDYIKQVMFENEQFVECYCHEINCLLLQKVIEQQKGSILLLCVIYEAVARRLGVKVKLTATCSHSFISWSSSLAENKQNTCYLIDISNSGALRKATACPISGKLPDHYSDNSIPNLFWTFIKTMEQFYIKDMNTYKYIFDFQKLLKPEDAEVEHRCKMFHQNFEYCRCPLLKNSLNSYAKSCRLEEH